MLPVPAVSSPLQWTEPKARRDSKGVRPVKPSGVFGVRPLAGSFLTRRWSEMDSNPRFPPPTQHSSRPSARSSQRAAPPPEPRQSLPRRTMRENASTTRNPGPAGRATKSRQLFGAEMERRILRRKALRGGLRPGRRHEIRRARAPLPQPGGDRLSVGPDCAGHQRGVSRRVTSSGRSPCAERLLHGSIHRHRSTAWDGTATGRRIKTPQISHKCPAAR
jgi:hypothetical protein